MNAGENFDKGRFAGAIFPEQGNDFTAVDAEIDAIERPCAAELLGDAAHLKERRGAYVGVTHDQTVRQAVALWPRVAISSLPTWSYSSTMVLRFLSGLCLGGAPVHETY
jgi:hypothetical protein